MWLWASELHQLGFRRKRDRYWLCARRWGLRGVDHLSLYPWSEQTVSGPSACAALTLVELTEFHVTFVVSGERLHFYYHELGDSAWQSGRHTSRAELERQGCAARQLRGRADAIAEQFIAALGCSFRHRRQRSR